MFVIANDITTRDSTVDQIFRQAKAGAWTTSEQAVGRLQEIAEQCELAGAGALEVNVQQHFNTPEAMEFAVNSIQDVSGLRLCLSANDAEVLEAGLQACNKPPLVNYISVDELRLRQMLPVIAAHHAGVVLLVSDPASPSDAREMLQKAAVLIGAAREAGIPSADILVDPGLIHVTNDVGQRHMVEVLEFLRALPDASDPPVRSTCWLSNGSAGAPEKVRSAVETALLPLLAGAGLSAVFMDVLRRENRRTAYLLNVFANEVIYAESDVEI